MNHGTPVRDMPQGSPVVSMDVSVLMPPGDGFDPVAASAAMLATGMSAPEVIAGMMNTCGVAAARDAFLGWLGMRPTTDALLRVLDAVSAQGATVANDWLNEAITDGHVREQPGNEDHPRGLRLKGRGWITCLPAGMKVQGNLDLNGCTQLRELPADIQVKYDIHLEGCRALEGLPKGMDVHGNLRLGGCSGLKCLPEGLMVHGNLDLAGCCGLEALPTGLRVAGYLDLMGCQGIQKLPPGLRVGGNLVFPEHGAWDGMIPLDASIAGVMFTPMHHLRGITQEQWRDRYGEGPERVMG